MKARNARNGAKAFSTRSVPTSLGLNAWPARLRRHIDNFVADIYLSAH